MHNQYSFVEELMIKENVVHFTVQDISNYTSICRFRCKKRSYFAASLRQPSSALSQDTRNSFKKFMHRHIETLQF